MMLTEGWTPVDVVAEDAPVGVQLWPTVDDAKFGDNFTLSAVAVIRTENRRYVLWTYRNGQTRTFEVGETVATAMRDEHLAATG